VEGRAQEHEVHPRSRVGARARSYRAARPPRRRGASTDL